MKAFGLEIRKMSNVALFQDVDSILETYHIPKDGVNVGVQTLACAHALDKMLNQSSHLSVCTIRDCAEMCNIRISKERMQIYSAAHCMNWNSMLPEYSKMLMAMVLDDFRDVLNPKR